MAPVPTPEAASAILDGPSTEWVTSLRRHIFLTWGLATEWPEDPFEKQYKGMLVSK